MLVTAGLKAAVTPAGHPAAARETLLLDPLLPATWMAPAALEPTRSVSTLADAVRLKLGSGMRSTIVAALVSAPEVPVTLTEYVPGTADVPGLSVNALLHSLLAELKVAVTPLGTPETAKFTLPAKPF